MFAIYNSSRDGTTPNFTCLLRKYSVIRRLGKLFPIFGNTNPDPTHSVARSPHHIILYDECDGTPLGEGSYDDNNAIDIEGIQLFKSLQVVVDRVITFKYGFWVAVGIEKYPRLKKYYKEFSLNDCHYKSSVYKNILVEFGVYVEKVKREQAHMFEICVHFLIGLELNIGRFLPISWLYLCHHVNKRVCQVIFTALTPIKTLAAELSGMIVIMLTVLPIIVCIPGFFAYVFKALLVNDMKGQIYSCECFLKTQSPMVLRMGIGNISNTKMGEPTKAYMVSTKETPKETKKGSLHLFNDIGGIAKPDCLVVLMGSFGAGKTTLFDVLGKRKTISKMDDRIYRKNEKIWPDFERCITDYCEQLNIHHSAVTGSYVEGTLNFLKLQDIEDVQIGEAQDSNRGITVEEYKCVTIDVELVAIPKFLLLDEPTSALDS
ncbi:hypothetical protein BDA99DRAFT_540478 [Phascolomyces articulosus]|uniref:ABC transporter domain-containing protein n=1 Tax=Phascolomyces articulosus TaxID=60185 RepID=A0AAD5K3B5_9FUNG|nr:hypothetical protein BDA99DRAFT_540478 [Phascolomyces articulosus]